MATSNWDHEDDNSTTTTTNPILTPRTTAMDFLEEKDHAEHSTLPTHSMPLPGKIYIISSIESDRVLSLHSGKICLLPPDILGSSVHWICEESRGWLGFKNMATGRYLGYDEKGAMQTMHHHEGWESFCIRAVPKGFVLLMQHEARPWPHLWPIKARQDSAGDEVLEKVNAPVGEGLVWGFIEVQPTS